MSFPVPSAPLPPIDPSVLTGGPERAATGQQPGAGDGAAFQETLAGQGAAQVPATEAVGCVERVSLAEGPNAIRKAIHDLVKNGDKMSNAELIGLQLRVHEMSFQLESVSKAIEHGMSGTKTLLQTQA